ncbi:MAG: RNA polymerase subunit sigma [Rhodanobacter denitrificans]|uniref:RNA polymerase subunit sigma n=1 Tax=Rhodanobacter denitrificans TaxID=666685 RepID=A0A2W5K7W4_9GAMM|nr:MAG: RNA polymerase subunit sigma [Rhodanobacter denitrificans]
MSAVLAIPIGAAPPRPGGILRPAEAGEWDAMSAHEVDPAVARAMDDLLARARAGDPSALDELLPLVYADLRGMAARIMGRWRGQDTLQPTALVHDVFLRLVEAKEPVRLDDAAHFFGLASRIMRQLLVDRARRSGTDKRGVGWTRVDFEEALNCPELSSSETTLTVDKALDALADVDTRLAAIVELRFFAGLSVPAVASILGLDKRTVYRDWALAKIWLRERLEP